MNNFDREKGRDSFLSDLPPLGSVGKSPLSDLPPLGANTGRALAPLSKIPPKSVDSGLENKMDNLKLNPVKKKVETVPTFGFDSDFIDSL